jgi:hypothetical protein
MTVLIAECLFCWEAIEPDETIVLLGHDGDRETSLAAEPEIRERAGERLVHARCLHTALARPGYHAHGAT